MMVGGKVSIVLSTEYQLSESRTLSFLFSPSFEKHILPTKTKEIIRKISFIFIFILIIQGSDFALPFKDSFSAIFCLFYKVYPIILFVSVL